MLDNLGSPTGRKGPSKGVLRIISQDLTYSAPCGHRAVIRECLCHSCDELLEPQAYPPMRSANAAAALPSCCKSVSTHFASCMLATSCIAPSCQDGSKKCCSLSSAISTERLLTCRAAVLQGQVATYKPRPTGQITSLCLQWMSCFRKSKLHPAITAAIAVSSWT